MFEANASNLFFTSHKVQELKSVQVLVQDVFNSEIDKLRQNAFPSVKPVDTSYDEFDGRSKHIVIKIDNVIAAYGRLTPGPNAVFENWTHGKAEIPTGEDVVDLGRCLVNSRFNGLGLLTLVFLAGVNYAKENGFKYVVGSVIPHEKVGPKLYKLGFLNCGNPVYEDEPNESNILVQPLACNVEQNHHLWSKVFQEQAAYLKQKGYYLLNFMSSLTTHPKKSFSRL